MQTVDVVVPEGVQDQARPSGGNTYDVRLCEALAEHGWSARLRPVPGNWPRAGRGGSRALGEALATIPDGSVAMVDGLVSSAAPQVVVPEAHRLRLVVLMHMPLGIRATRRETRARESGVVGAAAALVTPSQWCRTWLVREYGVDPARIHVARPGVDLAELAVRTSDGGRLLCVGAVTPAKGYDVLLAALSRLTDLKWRCVCVGATTIAPEYVARLRRDIQAAGLGSRLVLAGPRTSRELGAAYGTADLLVHASRAETYGMVVAEALSRGLPVVAGHAGGVPEALGVTRDGRLPGLLIPPGDVTGLAGALRLWLCDDDLRRCLREAASRRRAELRGWPDTAARVARVLEEVSS